MTREATTVISYNSICMSIIEYFSQSHHNKKAGEFGMHLYHRVSSVSRYAQMFQARNIQHTT